MKSEKVQTKLKTMPELKHSFEGREFKAIESEVFTWLAQQPEILQWVFDHGRQNGCLIFDPKSGTWRGKLWVRK